KHPALKDVGDHSHRLRIGPVTFGRRIDPDRARPSQDGPLEPDLAGLGIEMLDRAAGGDDLVRAHRRIADKDHAVVPAVGVEQIAGRKAFVMPAAVMLPYALVEAVVEIEVREPLELALGAGKELFGRLDVPVHRAADIEKQEDLDGVAPLRAQLHVDIALVGGRADRSVEVELLGRALASEPAQPAQRELDVARTEFGVAVEIPELALVPDFDGAAAAAPVLADPNALGVVAVGPEGRRSARSDPLRSALMAPFLFAEALAERLHQPVEAELFDLGPLLGTEIALGEAPPPLFRQLLGLDRRLDRQHALESGGEDD